MNYPKILIIGQYFHKKSGSGITLTNLFRGWDKENIAVATQDIHNPDFEVCHKNYQLGSLEIKRRFPFNLNRWKKPIKSGIIEVKEIPAASSFAADFKKSGLKKLYLDFLHFTGLYYYKNRYKISNEFFTWVKTYSPDIIYSQLSNIELIDFVCELHKTLGTPVAIHIMDDWPSTISNKGLFQSYWKKIIDKRFRELLHNAKVLLSIGEAMSKEYKSRYHLNFIPFHNPIDLNFWGLYPKTDYELNGSFKILYAGRIGPGIQNCFLEVAEAIERLNLQGLKIELHIQATTFDPILDDLAKFDFVKIKDRVQYNELPAIFSKADLLLLPNDFDPVSVTFLKYSMPTKASEYMVSGTPVLVYSSIETAVASHALKYNWAYVVSENSKEKIVSAISELYQKKELRTMLGTTAKEYAIDNYNDVKIRDRFRKSFAEVKQ